MLMVRNSLKAIITLFLLVIIQFCTPINDKVPAWDAQTQINAAAEFKAKECSSPVPQPPLYVFTDQIQRNLDLCSIAITRTNCPFTGYPIICMGIYLSKPVSSLHWLFNFDEFAKQKFKFE